MALLSELVQVIAKREGLEEVSVGIFARHAREAGLISQGGRGRSAAKMSIRDAANLLIAVNGCALAKEVAERVPLIRDLPVRTRSRTLVSKLGRQTATFGEDFEAIIELMANDDRFRMPGDTFVRFFKPFSAVEVRVYPSTDERQIEEVIKYEDESLWSSGDLRDRSDETVISHVTLQAVARLIAG